jgi:hypothetical protein
METNTNSEGLRMAKYKMIHKETGEKKEFKKGLSFTALFFSGFVAMSRDQKDEYKTSKFAARLATATVFTMGFANLIFLFKFNEMFKNHLEKNGFTLEENVSVSI